MQLNGEKSRRRAKIELVRKPLQSQQVMLHNLGVVEAHAEAEDLTKDLEVLAVVVTLNGAHPVVAVVD